MAIARLLSGTWCSFPPFMRSAGTVHTPVSRSISDHFAPITSEVRAAVRMANSRARAEMLSRSRSSAMKLGSSAKGRAGWCLTLLLAPLLGSGLPSRTH